MSAGIRVVRLLAVPAPMYTAIDGDTQSELAARIGHNSTRVAAIYQQTRTEGDRWIADQLDHLATAAPDEQPPPQLTVPPRALRAAAACTRPW